MAKPNKKAAENQELSYTSQDMNVEIKVRDYNGTKFCTLILYEDIIIYNCKIVNGKNGAFLSFPRYEGKTKGEYWNYAYVAKDSDLAKEIQEVVDQIIA